MPSESPTSSASMPGPVEQPGHRGVVRRQHRDFLAAPLHLPEIRHANLFAVHWCHPPSHRLDRANTVRPAARASLSASCQQADGPPPRTNLATCGGMSRIASQMRGDRRRVASDDRSGQGRWRPAGQRVLQRRERQRPDRAQGLAPVDPGLRHQRHRGVEDADQRVARHHGARVVLAKRSASTSSTCPSNCLVSCAAHSTAGGSPATPNVIPTRL